MYKTKRIDKVDREEIFIKVYFSSKEDLSTLIDSTNPLIKECANHRASMLEKNLFSLEEISI